MDMTSVFEAVDRIIIERAEVYRDLLVLIDQYKREEATLESIRRAAYSETDPDRSMALLSKYRSYQGVLQNTARLIEQQRARLTQIDQQLNTYAIYLRQESNKLEKEIGDCKAAIASFQRIIEIGMGASAAQTQIVMVTEKKVRAERILADINMYIERIYNALSNIDQGSSRIKRYR